MHPDRVCDRIRNCVDGSDEGDGCLRRNCTHLLALRCEHRCVGTPGGPVSALHPNLIISLSCVLLNSRFMPVVFFPQRCLCPAGFRLHPNTGACSDSNECVGTRHKCKHICVNAPGSYSCRCHAGFYLEPDGTSCKSKGESFMFWGERSRPQIKLTKKKKADEVSSFVRRPL